MIVHTLYGVAVEWDPEKARANVLKHGIAFSDASGALEDPYALTREDPHPDEERWVSLGLDHLGRLVVVAFTWRGDIPRIISARPATAGERRAYMRGLE